MPSTNKAESRANSSLPSPPTPRKKGVSKPQQTHSLRLAVELVPQRSWSKNVRAVVAQDIWDTLRFYFRATKETPPYMRRLDLPHPGWSPLTCSVCGAEKDNLELHECWEYDDEEHVQTLSNLIPICDRCHNVIHFGRASQLGLADQAHEHLCKVNSFAAEDGRQHIADAYEVWLRRSEHAYAIKFDKLLEFLPEGWIHPEWLRKPKFWSGDRLDAIRWARDRLSASDVVIVDTETTGLISGKHANARAEVIEIAILSTRGKLLYSSRFRPKYKIPKRTTAIHGLTVDALNDCPTFLAELPRMLSLLNGKTVLSYNDRFDSGVMAKTCAMYKAAPPDCQWECVMRMYRAYIEAPRFVKLPGGVHGAVQDCRATLRLLRSMAKQS